MCKLGTFLKNMNVVVADGCREERNEDTGAHPFSRGYKRCVQVWLSCRQEPAEALLPALKLPRFPSSSPLRDSRPHQSSRGAAPAHSPRGAGVDVGFGSRSLRCRSPAGDEPERGASGVPEGWVSPRVSPVCPRSAECPLTAAAQLELSAEMIKALRNGGAHLDFRTREGMTALHKAVRCRNHAALLVSGGGRGSPSLALTRALAPAPPRTPSRLHARSVLPGREHPLHCCRGTQLVTRAWH